MEYDLRKQVVIFQPGRFSLGRLVATSAVAAALTTGDIGKALGRHASGDWGDLDEHDWEANEDAIEYGGRLLSIYHAESNGERFWVITDADRSATTVLFPSEY